MSYRFAIRSLFVITRSNPAPMAICAALTLTVKEDAAAVYDLIARAEKLLHGLVTLLQALLVIAAALVPCAVGRCSAAVQRGVFRTPVRWKIRLND